MNRGGRPPVPRAQVACRFCGVGVEKTEKEAARIRRAVCVDCRAARKAVPWQCRSCGAQKTLPATLASHISRCEECRPAELQPMATVRATCEQCGVSFECRVAAGRTVRFCGNPCRLAWFSTAFVGVTSPQWLGGKSLLYGTHWKAVRHFVYVRDGNQCRSCGATRGSGINLIAAHLMPRRSFEAYALSSAVSDHPANLIALCGPCHTRFDRHVDTRWNYETGTRTVWPEWTAQRVVDKLDWAREMVALYEPVTN